MCQPVFAPLLACLLLLAACAGPSVTPDAGAPDAGISDAGHSDAGADDGGPDGGGIPPWPDTADAYTPELVAYVHSLQKPAKVGLAYACCRDFGAISRDKIEEGRDDIDNAIVGFFDTLAFTTGVDLQASIDANLQDDSLTILFDHWGYRTPDTPFVLARLDGSFEGSTTYTDAAAGNGTFLVSRESFVPGTGEPSTQLDAVISSAGELHATGPSLDFTLGLYGAALTMKLDDLTFDGTADEMPTTIGYRRGKMSGYVTVDAFFEAMNTFAANNCACLGLAGALFSKDGAGAWSGACQPGAAALCTAPDESFCVTMGDDGATSGCTLTPQVLPGAADLDLDGDPSTFEALSLGFAFEAKPASVVGLTP